MNGDIITKTDLEQRQIAALRQRDPNFRPGSDAELQKALAEVTPDVIVNAVDELLLVQRGRELGYTLGNEQFRNIVENIKKENKLETDEQFQAALKQEGMTIDDLRQQLERQMLVSRVQQVEVMGKISVTEDEVKKFYDEQQETLHARQPQITLREILVDVPASDKGVNVAEDDAAKAKAEEIRKRARGRGAVRASSRPSSPIRRSKANGGLIGPISRDDLSPELQKEIDAAEGRADDARAAHHARLSDHQARNAHRDARSRRSTRRARRLPTASPAQKQRGQMLQLPPAAARAGDHRLEERRGEEGLRASACKQQQAAAATPDRSANDAELSGLPSGRGRATKSSCAISSQQKHVEVFLPTITKWSRWKDRKKKIDWPLFPGYCFARFDGDRSPADSEVRRRGHASSAPTGMPSPIPADRDRRHPAADRERAGLRSLPAHQRGHDGRSEGAGR